MRQIVRQIDIAEHIRVGQTQIGVKQYDVFPGRSKTYRQIYRDVALSDAALAAGDGDHAGARALLDEGAKLAGLVNHGCHNLSPRINSASRRPRPTSMSSGTSWPVVI